MLTAYQLACGQSERVVVDTNPRQSPGFEAGQATLWREHGAYHVRTHVFGRGRIGWEVFRTLGPARKAFRAHAAFLRQALGA